MQRSAVRLWSAVTLRSAVRLWSLGCGSGSSWAWRWWRLASRRVAAATRGEAGMSTVEYAIGTVAAAAFAAVLYTVLTGGSVVAALEALVARALSVDY